jgi:hypothetical protein
MNMREEIRYQMYASNDDDVRMGKEHIFHMMYL